MNLTQGFANHHTCSDIMNSKESHSDVPIHHPFLSLEVGLAAVVHEARVVAFGPCVNDAIFVHRQHVEVCDVVVMGLLDTALTLFFVDQITHIFIYKLALKHSLKKYIKQCQSNIHPQFDRTKNPT